MTDLTPLENHNNLQDVTFTDVPIEDIEVFSNKTQIFRIALKRTNIRTLASLNNLSELEYSSISDNPQLTTLGGQFNTPKLYNATLNNNALESLDGLSGLPELASISAEGNMLTDVEFITTLSKLEGSHFNGNCLDADAIEVWVDWWNEHRTTETTVEEALEGQNPSGKCGW